MTVEGRNSLREKKKDVSEELFADAIKLRRVVVFWSAILLFYVWGELGINLIAGESGGGFQTPWGVPITNLTEEKLLLGLFVIQAYFFWRCMILVFAFFVSKNTEESHREVSEAFHYDQGVERGNIDPNYLAPEQPPEVVEYYAKEARYKLILRFIRHLFYKVFPILIPIVIGGIAFGEGLRGVL
ncbi:MAG: hypothetical protein ACR2N8_04705 [Parvibaculales bacterium]